MVESIQETDTLDYACPWLLVAVAKGMGQLIVPQSNEHTGALMKRENHNDESGLCMIEPSHTIQT